MRPLFVRVRQTNPIVIWEPIGMRSQKPWALTRVDNLKSGQLVPACCPKFVQRNCNAPRKASARSVKLGFGDAIPKPALKPVKVGAKNWLN